MRSAIRRLAGYSVVAAINTAAAALAKSPLATQRRNRLQRDHERCKCEPENSPWYTTRNTTAPMVATTML